MSLGIAVFECANKENSTQTLWTTRSTLAMTLLLSLIAVCTGCAERRSAQVLSQSVNKGLEIHRQFDDQLYRSFVSALRKEVDAIASSKRSQIETIRYKYQLAGHERLAAIFQQNIAELDKDLNRVEGSTFPKLHERLSDAVKSYSESPTASKKKALIVVVTEYRQAVSDDTKTRSGEIEAEIKAFEEHVKSWKEIVDAEYSLAVKAIDHDEEVTEQQLDRLEASISTMQGHFKAVQGGSEQIAAFINQKSPVQLSLEGFMQGVGLNLPVPDVDAFIGRVASQYEIKLEKSVDSFNTRMAEARERKIK